jgi:PQQ system protein
MRRKAAFRADMSVNEAAGGTVSKTRRWAWWDEGHILMRRWLTRHHIVTAAWLLPPFGFGLLLGSCDYARLARPSVLSELTPPVARLVDELPDLDAPNKALVAQLYAVGGLGKAKEGTDGVMQIDITAVPHRFMWQPAIIDMPHGGTLDVHFSNYDDTVHAAYMPSVGGQQVLDLPIHKAGIAHIRLDEPGLYWFGCPVADHVGRGMLGLIIVRGNAPAEARLDRPRQVQPNGR